MLDVNVKGVWRMIRATLPQFRKQKEGLIISISSAAGRFALPFNALYASSKFALEGLIGSMQLELNSLGIESVLVQPGTYNTGLITKHLPGSNPDVIAEYGPVAKIPEQMAEGLKAYFKIHLKS